MKDLRKEYQETKCCKCNNKKLNPIHDKCDIRVYQFGNYMYCKCCNMSGKDKELKEKVI